MTLSASLIAALRIAVGKRWVLTDPAALLAYESDALTLFRCQPGAIVLPQSQDEILRCAQLFQETQTPWCARGAGTGLSGGALVPPGGVILGLSRMNRILDLDPDTQIAVVEPGVVNADLDRAASAHGLRYAPDPASWNVCTLGGNVAENAGGPRCFLHGTTTNHVLWADVVLPDGSLERWGDPSGEQQDLDLRGFLVGSEGAIAVATKIGLRLQSRPATSETLLAAWPSIRPACETVAAVVASGLLPVALEVMDQAAICAIEDSNLRAGLPTDAGAILLLEMEGGVAQVAADTDAMESLVRAHGPTEVRRARTARERLALWKGRKGAGGALGRLGRDSLVMDGVVPRSRLADIMDVVSAIRKETGLPIANLFHAGDGNIHPHFSYDARDPEQAAQVIAAGDRILRACLDMGGSLSGEHGIGVEKEHLLAEQFDEASLALQHRLAQAFNPDDLLNPGKGLPLRRGCMEVFRRHSPAKVS